MILLEEKNEILKKFQRYEKPNIYLREGSYVIRNLITEEDMIKAYHLRHRIFCEELSWVPQTENRLEMDEYDVYAIPFGVFNGQNNLSAFIRLVTDGNTLMIEKEFSSLVGRGHMVRKENDTGETSRICVAPEARNDVISGDFGVQSVSMLLYKGVYYWCITHDIRYIYTVVAYKMFRLLRAKGFSIELIGDLTTMPDGVVAVAVIMDWREFETSNKVKRPDMFRWFNQCQSVPAQSQSQGHGFC